ncbi:hypothetical protein BRARA_H00829 [Brassica rapa]|uniref:Late embryogenesis abundant protein Lea5 n=1 Tax=Brassica campestris TaxID=3711 RepID=A0A397YHA8_BRACM|nr:hypothetical protein BRARA_H00829 [Brassica rapa]
MAARSLPGAVKSLFSTASGSVSRSIVLRSNYVATSPGLLSKGCSTRAESAWAPDPVTGYYRPSNCADEIDPAELRKMLLENKAKPF